MASVRTYITETEFAKIDNPQSSTTYIVLDDNDPTLVKKVVFKTNNINNEGEVYVVQDEYPTPSGAVEITANGDNIDVKQYATANVNVPNPSTGTLNITENDDYDVTEYAGVSVNVPNPSTGTLNITENDDYDVTEYAGVSVNVPNPSTGTLNITSNDTYDVTNYASAQVNVPNPSTGTLVITSNDTFDVTNYASAQVNVQGANDDLAYISGLNLSIYPTDTIEDERFANYPALASVNLSGITTIGESAFEDCTALTSLSNTEGIISCGANTFKGCTSLKKVSTPNMSTIPDGFCDGDPIETWNSDSITTTVGKNAFRGAKMPIINMTSMQSIDDGGFNYDLTNDNKEVSIKVPSTPPSLGTDSLPTPIKEIEVENTVDIQTYTNDPDWAPYASKLVCYEQTMFHYDLAAAASESTTLNWSTEESFTISARNGNVTKCYSNDRFPELYSVYVNTSGGWILRSVDPNRNGLLNSGTGERALAFRKLHKDDVVLVIYGFASAVDTENSSNMESANSHLVTSNNDSYYSNRHYKSLFLCIENGPFSVYSKPSGKYIQTIDINPVGYYPFSDYNNLSDSSWIPSFGIDTTDTITLNGETLYKLTAGAWNGMYVSSNNISIGSQGLHIDDTNGVTIGFKANSDYTYVEAGMAVSSQFIAYNMTFDSVTGKYMIDDPTLDFGFHLDNLSVLSTLVVK